MRRTKFPTAWRPCAAGGAALAFGVCLGGPAVAQSCNSTVPPPPAPAVNTNFANQTFTPTTPYSVGSLGATGCNGAAGNPYVFSGTSGQPGYDGQGGGAVTTVNTGLRFLGGQQGAPLQPSYAAPINSIGGSGGTGGYGGYPDNNLIQGGNGGQGATGGNVTVQFNAQVTPLNGQAADYGSSVVSAGGYGGKGGDGYKDGIYNHEGGAGGNAGAAGTVTVQASGSYQVNASAVFAQAYGGLGGSGGNVPQTSDLGATLYGGQGGNGGAGGAASIQFSGTVTSGLGGLQAVTRGGDGATGGYVVYSYSTQSGNGGNGGAGGTASVKLSGGSITVVQPLALTNMIATGIEANSIGGRGGNAGSTNGGTGVGGGSGGNGGNGGPASATVLGGIALTVGTSATTDPLSGYGVFVQSNGGSGGSGAGVNAVVGEAGGGGLAGGGGSAGLTVGDASHIGTIRTAGNFAAGALAQSVGGSGGGGGNASFALGGGYAGAGQAGGDGGPVTVSAPNASIITTGPNSTVLLAQSIGGGGGSGGDARDIAIGAGISVGGNGGLGGNGGGVTVNLGPGVFASTNALGGGGVLAQSIGSSGGAAGSASTTGIGLISFAIGGDAGSGGLGGPVSVTNGGLVTTYGDHAVGLQGQSIGGGGGKGGAAVSFSGGAVPTASVSIGGRGGSGGQGSNVTVANSGQIATYGADAYGVLLQSIGGGGGSGGAAAARAVSLSPSKYVPAVSISVALEGSGGSGNLGGTVRLSNSGLITTAGDGAIGVVAQSIGGGGGTGGDATAASYSNGPQAGVSISVATAVGGSGGSGGRGGAVTLTNAGLIATVGQDAYGVLAQSVGGGGGVGGAGDTSAFSGKSKASVGASVAVGGTGGTGGDGGLVSLTSGDAITTSGDGSDAVFAQSVGGGGGAGGGGVATANGGKLSIAVGVGGKGGAGGSGSMVGLSNSGTVVTRGTDSVGLLAQSVGGGGGKGGKGGATAGGASPEASAKALFDDLANGLGFGTTATNLGDGILQLALTQAELQASLDELKSVLAQPQAGAPVIGAPTSLQVAVSVGGSGGAAGTGGPVGVTNTGSVETFGAQSDGVFAQSVGGGGGKGGAASSAAKFPNDMPAEASLAVGGVGGAGGAGGTVTVSNGSGGTIETQGVLAFGITAQSVGGGGGAGSVAGTVDGSLKSLGLGLGGSGRAGGDGGAVTVSTGDGTAGSLVSTTGKHGIGILAQSIGGGGGLARTMTTDQTFDPSKILNNPQGRFADIQGLSIDLGGADGAGGRGGAVEIDVSGPLTTAGLDAHAAVAQSIGGGGGFVAGGQFIGPRTAGGGSANRTGDGGAVTIRMQPGAAIVTTGTGAFGLLAQSIGGGGGFAGDPSGGYNGSAPVSITYVRDIPISVQRSGSGSGGDVAITLERGSVQTTGPFAPAIVAQSVGGGGGIVVQKTGDSQATFYRGSTAGGGNGGNVTVSLVNAVVAATGAGSAGILAQSTGQATGTIRISVDQGSSVTGGLFDPDPSGQDRTQRDAAAIRILGGTGNTISNAGTIRAVDATGYAILADSSRVTYSGSGTVFGNVSIPAGGTLDILPGGTAVIPATANLGGGLLRNAGTFYVGGIATVCHTTITGDLVQTGTGTLVVDVGPGRGAADLLEVRGKAVLAGGVAVQSAAGARLRSGASHFAVLTATGGVTQSGLQASAETPVVRYTLSPTDANTLAVNLTADYAGSLALGATNLRSANRAAVGHALNTIFAADASSLDPIGARIAGVRSPQILASVLDGLSGEAAASAQQTVFATQEAFASMLIRHASGGGDGGVGAGAAGPSLEDGHGVRVWVGGIGYSAVLSGTDGRGSLHSQAGGGALGLERWFDKDRMVGVSVGGSTIGFSTPDRGSEGRSASANLSAYGLARYGAAYLAGTLGYGHYDTDLKRPALGYGLGLAALGRGSFGTDVVGGRVEVGWRRVAGPLTLTPFAALEVDHLWQGGFGESATGAAEAQALALRFAGERRISVPFTLGGRAGAAFDVLGHVLAAAVELSWVHEFSPDRTITGAFAAAPDASFRVSGTSASRDAAAVGVNARLALAHGVSLYGNVNGRFSGVETALGGFGGLGISW